MKKTMYAPARHASASRAAALAQRPRAALLGLAALMVGGLLVSGCNTTAGAGQDVKATGSAITRGAEDVKSKL